MRWGRASGAVSRARLLWHVTANEASPTVQAHGRLDTRQDNPAQRVSRVTTADGRSPGSRVVALHRLPEPGGSVTSVVKGSPLTVAGAAAALGRAPHRVPF